MLRSPWIHNARHPDTFSLRRLVAHERFAGRQDEELALALWRYTVDPVAGFYHFWSPADLDVHRPYHPNDYVKDPLKLINGYGYMLCGTVAAIYANLCEEAGLEAAIVGVTGHTLNEVRYGGAWRLIDCDLRAIHRRPDGQIASLKDLLAHPDLVANPVARSDPYYVADRDPESMAKSLYAPGKGGQMPRFIERLHTMDYLLRPGERLVLYPGPREERWSFPAHWVEDSKKYQNEWHGRGPRERFEPHRTYSNGCFEYAPDLTHTPEVHGAWLAEGVAQAGGGLRAAGGKRARIEYLIHSPWPITGRVLDPGAPSRKEGAAFADLNVEAPKAGDAVNVLITLDGETWERAARAERSGALHADFTRWLERRHRARIALEFEGGAEARDFKLTTWFQHAPNAYPFLDAGRTMLKFHAGDERGGGTLTEPWVAPLEEAAGFARTIVAASNLKRGDAPYVRLSPEDASKPWSAVFKAAPRVFRGRPIHRAWVQASIQSFKGHPDAPPPEYLSRPPRAKLEAACAPDGPWTPIDERVAPVHEHGYHFSLDGEYLPAQAAEAIFLRVTADLPGWEVRAGLSCEPPACGEVSQLEIEHAWTRDGIACRHLERFAASNVEGSYVVETGAGRVEDVSVTLRALGVHA
ncbi:MAG: hypothetical protein M5U26_30225 [Planctomycetota bacterium]|nr:hypothetical protein [Planctomycetota bacterium]